MLESIILGLLQGLAEFLPVSSSGHLVLGKAILKMQEAGMFFDIMLHAGTLLSIFVIFRKKICDMLLGIFRREKEQLNYALFIIIASVPTAVVGIGFKDQLESLFQNPRAVCVALLVTGTLLFCTKFAPTGPKYPEAVAKPMNWWRALITGTVQGIACIPGISRSGSTTSFMLYMGISRKYAGEFTFLMSIPAVGGAALLDFLDWFKCQGPDKMTEACQNAGVLDAALLVGMLVSFVSGIFALKWLMAFVQKGKLHYFSWYVWAVGIIGLILLR